MHDLLKRAHFGTDKKKKSIVCSVRPCDIFYPTHTGQKRIGDYISAIVLLPRCVCRRCCGQRAVWPHTLLVFVPDAPCFSTSPWTRRCCVLFQNKASGALQFIFIRPLKRGFWEGRGETRERLNTAIRRQIKHWRWRKTRSSEGLRHFYPLAHDVVVRDQACCLLNWLIWIRPSLLSGFGLYIVRDRVVRSSVRGFISYTQPDTRLAKWLWVEFFLITKLITGAGCLASVW